MIDVSDQNSVSDSDDDSSDGNEESYFLESLRHWDVAMPPAKEDKRKNWIKTSLKSKLGVLLTKNRRVTIELYTKTKHKTGHGPRSFPKLDSRASVANLSLDNEDDLPPLGNDDFVIFRVLKEDKPKPFGIDWKGDDDDSTTTSRSHANGDFEAKVLTTYNTEDYGDRNESESDIATHWKERYRSRIAGMEATPTESTTVEIELGNEDASVVRELIFDSSHELETFMKTFNKMRDLQHERGVRMAAGHKSDAKVIKAMKKREHKIESESISEPARKGKIESDDSTSDPLNLLIEIVSATNLPAADVGNTSDPFVCVEDGRLRWHKTNHITKTLNPVWTLSSGSLFLIQTSIDTFFNSRLEFVVKDHDNIGAADVLGSVFVSKNDVIMGDGERVEYELNTKNFQGKYNTTIHGKKSFLTLRFKQATEDEISFIRSYNENKESGVLSKLGLSSNTGVFADECYLPPRTHKAKLYKRQERKATDGMTVTYRLKPFADPNRPEDETKWLSHTEILRESVKPSENWIEAGSGSAGKLYFEILGCDGLPNLDISASSRNKSDPFVCITFEDCVVNTDVINDCLSPRWMPWTQRAFVFNVMHPSSQFYIAVMDHEGIKSHHDKIGRCAVNVTNIRPNMMYNMRYSLLNSDEKDRKVTGKIMFRLRFESSNERQLLLSPFQLRKEYYVSTNSNVDKHTLTYALTHDYNRYALSLLTINKYVDEIFEYELFLDDFYEAINVVIYWRGHYPVNFTCLKKSYSFKLPIHSVTAFTWGILLSFNFDRIASFICFLVAWLLLATMGVQQNNPNPWKRPRSYIDMLGTFIFNKSFAYQKIEANENIEEIIDYDEMRKDLEKFRRDTIETKRIQNEKEEIQFAKERRELEKKSQGETTDLTKIPGKVLLTPFKPIIEPVQIFLYRTCIYIRVLKSVLMWRDSAVAFLVTSIALSLSAILFFLPLTFLLRWTFRILVFVFLGPWMKLVDIFFVSNNDINTMTPKEREAKIKAEMKERYSALLSESQIKRKIKEFTMKQRDMERYMFGQYGVRVPIYKEERFASTPLAGSSVEPYDSSDEPSPNIVRRIKGQVLSGNMIPKRQDPAKKFEELDLSESKVPSEISANKSEAKHETAPLLEDKDEDMYGDMEPGLRRRNK